MKRNQLFAILALMLALGIPIPAVLFATGADGELSSSVSKKKATGEQVFDEKSPETPDLALVLTEAELFAAIDDVKVTHIALSEHIIVTRDIVINRDLKIDLNGHNIISCGSSSSAQHNSQPVNNARVLDIVAGKVEITGAGHIMALGADSAAVRIRGATDADQTDFASVTIGPDVILNAPNYYALFVTPNFNAAYGVTVNFAGTIIARDGFCINSRISRAGDNVPVINVLDGAKIIVDEHVGTAIYAAGFGTWNLGAAEITGASGLTVKSGTLTLTGTRIQTTGAFENFETNPEATGVGAVVQIEESDPYIGNIHLEINSGEYISQHSYVFAKYSTDAASIESLRSLTIEDGHFIGNNAVLQGNGIFYGLAPHDAEHDVALVLGGEFNADISDYLTKGYHLEKDSITRTFTVIDESKPAVEPPSPAELMAQAESELRAAMELAEHYTAESYAGKELGDLQIEVNKVTSAAKRNLRSAKRLLSGTKEVSLDQIQNARKKLITVIDDFQRIEDDLRAEILSSIAAARAIDPADFSNYSYNLLMDSVRTADRLLVQSGITLEQLYSVFCDIELNTELLEDPEDGEVPATPAPALPLPTPPIPELSAPAPSILPEPAAPNLELVHELEAAATELTPADEELLETAEQVDIASVTAILQHTLVSELLNTSETDDAEVARLLDGFAESNDIVAEDSPEAESIVADINPSAEDAETSADVEFAEAVESVELVAEAMEADELDEELVEAVVTAAKSEPVVEVNPELATAVSNLRNLLNAATALNPEEYTAESYAPFTAAVSRAGELLNTVTPNSNPTVLINAFNEINSTYSKLAKRPNNPATLALEKSKANLVATLQAVRDLTVNDYQVDAAEQFGELQVAIARASAVLGHNPILPEEIMSVMDEIRAATSGLKGADESASPTQTAATVAADAGTYHPPVMQPTIIVSEAEADWTALRQVVAQISMLNSAEFTAESYAGVLAGLERAKAALGNPRATQAEVNAITAAIIAAMRALRRVPAPANYYANSYATTGAAATAQPLGVTSGAVGATGAAGYSGAVSVSGVVGASTDPAGTTAYGAPRPLIAEATSAPQVTPSWLMSMMAGAYAGLATYRKSRADAKQHKLAAGLSKRMLYQK